MLNVGTNFAPEHLEEMFEEPRLGIKRMEMRFRPYVEQATYYQFLKGMYSIITLTSRLMFRLLLRHGHRDAVPPLASRSVLHPFIHRPRCSASSYRSAYCDPEPGDDCRQ
jgi:hypothetical protein